MLTHNPNLTIQTVQKEQKKRQERLKNRPAVLLYDEDETIQQSTHPILTIFLEAENPDSILLTTNFNEELFNLFDKFKDHVSEKWNSGRRRRSPYVLKMFF